MRLIKRGQDGELSLTDELFDEIPPYAVLSHTWSQEAAEEITFADMASGSWRTKPASTKLKLCSEQASRDGLEYSWVDTCCINKATTDELQSSINSMFQWYRDAAQCYVYLSDVSMQGVSWKEAFRRSKWFTRGWTLQELLAPASVQFFSREGLRLGDKASLEQEIHDITKIPTPALQNARPFSQFDVDERFMWANTRLTTREEDWAYCLLGIFGVFMPLNYGEGRENSVRRLRREIESTPKRHDWLKQLYKCSYQDRKDRNLPRAEGTCQWFTGHPRFQHWKQNTTTRLLWVSADPGCGKSVLSKYLVDEVLPSTTKTTTCYFFFKEDFPDQRSSVTALCSILHQVFYHHPASFSTSILDELEEKGNTVLSSFGDLWRLLLSTATAQKREIICILDALDECEVLERDMLIESISKFCTSTATQPAVLKFILTSRPYLDIKRSFRGSGCDLARIHLKGDNDEEATKISNEIDMVIRSRAAQLSRKMPLNQEEHDVLVEELTRTSSRTYLWVDLVFGEIQKGILLTPGKIRSQIRNIPHTVSQAYQRILSRSPNSARTRKLLHIVVAAETPLTLQEMALAMSIDPGDKSVSGLDANSEERFRDEIRELCGLFVVIVDFKVYLLHQTAREFLVPPLLETTTSPRGSTTLEWQHSLHPEKSHCVLARVCMLRLSCSDFDLYGFRASSDKHRYARERTFLQYAALQWADHLRQGSWDDEDPGLKEATSLCRSDLPTWTWFEIYRAHTNRHIPAGQLPPVLVASYFGLSSILKQLSEEDLKLVKVKDGAFGRSATHWAANNGHAIAVQLLLRSRIARRFLWTRSNVNGRDIKRGTPLHLASIEGHNAVVECLLKRGANINAKDDSGHAPLHWAARKGHKAVVQCLLKEGAKINAKDGSGHTPLHWAAMNGRSAVTQCLLKEGANINAKNKSGHTPLHLASIKGSNAVVQCLLSGGADINAKDNTGDTPLHRASIKGHIVVVQCLLCKGGANININAMNHYSYTSLHLASELGHEAVVQCLLRGGANINAEGNTGNTPLHQASMKGHDAVV